MGGHDKGKNVKGKTLMQFITVYPSDKALSCGGGSKEALRNWSLYLPGFFFTVIWSKNSVKHLTLHRTKIAKEDEFFK